MVESERPSTISEIAVEVVLLMRSYCSHSTYACIPSKGLKYSIHCGSLLGLLGCDLLLRFYLGVCYGVA